MEKDEVVKMIDDHKNKLIDPVEMLHWTWLRVIVNEMTESEWQYHVSRATEIMSR